MAVHNTVVRGSGFWKAYSCSCGLPFGSERDLKRHQAHEARIAEQERENNRRVKELKRKAKAKSDAAIKQAELDAAKRAEDAAALVDELQEALQEARDMGYLEGVGRAIDMAARAEESVLQANSDLLAKLGMTTTAPGAGRPMTDADRDKLAEYRGAATILASLLSELRGTRRFR